MKLLIVRHAIAMDRNEYQAERAVTQVARKDDNLRPLTPEGIRKMKKNARGLARLIAAPAVLVTSPLTRAIQTSEILNEVWPSLDQLECEALEPGSKPIELLKWLRSHVDDEAHCICLIGHEPHLSKLIGWFLNGESETLLDFKKGGACLIDFDGMPSRNSGRLIWHVTPSILRSCR